MNTTYNPTEFLNSLKNFEFEKVTKDTIDDLQDIVTNNPECTIENFRAKIGELPLMFWTFVLTAINIQKVLSDTIKQA